MENSNNLVIVALFVRVPVPGRVKTRLASDLGNDGACKLYCSMVADILTNIKACGFPIYLFHDGKEDSALPKEWIESSARVIIQEGGDIGERMAAAFEHCFNEGVGQVVLAGSDIPGLNARIVLSASTALESHDIAIAPANDGGYCLIALKCETYQCDIFKDIPWSTGQVLRSTLEKCMEAKQRVGLLEALQDIDTIDDLKAYCHRPAKLADATNRLLMASGFL